MAARKRRGPKHPGVTLKRPDEKKRLWWRAQYRDPDSGRIVRETLPRDLTTLEQREDWAVRKSRTLAKRRMELEGGDARLVRRPMAEAVKSYFEVAEHRLRARTLETYRVAADRFLDWAKVAGVVTTTELTATKLPGFRDFLIAQRKQGYVAGGGRGARRPGHEKLSPQTINWQLRAVKTLLNHLRLRGVVPLSRDAISDALKPAPVPREAPEFLSPAECARLLEAALRHDGERFAETREEHAGLRPLGSTPRYDPIAPFVATVLLTGMRFGEALALKWSDVDLEAFDTDRQQVGEIRLSAEATKTAHARTIGLEVSPALRKVLAALKLRAGNSVYVFGGKGPMPRTLAEASRRRLIGTYGAPEFSWQTLRRTCGTYLTNAPGIFGAASAYRSAKQLGHAIQVAERHYVDVVRGIPREARTLEAAMHVEDVMARVVARTAGRASQSTASLDAYPAEG